MKSFNKKIIRYYNQTHRYYKHVWFNKNNLAMHLGLWDSNTRNRSEALINTNKIISKIAKIGQNDIVLDAGCGVGGSCIWIAKNLNAKTVGISINKIHVKNARVYASEHGVQDKTEFHVMDFVRTKFPPNKFDVVWTIESVCHAQDKGKFVSEARRILKKKGRIVVCDAWLTKKDYSKKEINDLKRFYEGFALPNLSYKSEFENILNKNGFRNIRFYDKTRSVFPTTKILNKWGRIFLPLAMILEKMKIISNLEIKNIVSAMLTYELLKKRTGIYGIFYAEKY